ncbi:MAG: alpha/beta hydrolase, partial [Acidobacteria bacterium]|nr:alpha/beta hydrolase [Candidatus Sulfomarinibacter sp. MAG AM1]
RFASVDVPSTILGVGLLVRRYSVVNRLPQIEVPSLVIVGDEDVSLPPSYSKEIASALPKSSMVVVPESGHLSSLEQPEAVTEAMMNFLNGLDRG